MPECWVCANPAQNHISPSADSTSVGVCRRCNIFGCNTHAEFDTRPGILYCAPCVGDGGSSPPTGPTGGPGGPTPGQPRTPDEPPISFSSAKDAEKRFPGLYRKSKGHADAFLARHDIAEMIQRLAPRWQELHGEQIDIQQVDEELIAFGIGVTLWSAGLIPGELPEASEGNLNWLVRNRLLSMYIGELVIGA